MSKVLPIHKVGNLVSILLLNIFLQGTGLADVNTWGAMNGFWPVVACNENFTKFPYIY
jgi:hypothetical protein